MNVNGEVATTSPGPQPAANAAPWRAAVPDENATAWRACTRSARAASNRSIVGPCVSQSPRKTSTTAATSSSSTLCRPYGIMATRESPCNRDPNVEAVFGRYPHRPCVCASQ